METRRTLWFGIIIGMVLCLLFVVRFPHDRSANPDPADRDLVRENIVHVADNDSRQKGRAYKKMIEDMTAQSVQRTEEHRKQQWMKRFPWKPVVDENFPYVPHKYVPRYRPTNSVEDHIIRKQKSNYVALRELYSNEVRYTVQFESMHDILSRYGRTNDPVLAKNIFQH